MAAGASGVATGAAAAGAAAAAAGAAASWGLVSAGVAALGVLAAEVVALGCFHQDRIRFARAHRLNLTWTYLWDHHHQEVLLTDVVFLHLFIINKDFTCKKKWSKACEYRVHVVLVERGAYQKRWAFVEQQDVPEIVQSFPWQKGSNVALIQWLLLINLQDIYGIGCIDIKLELLLLECFDSDLLDGTGTFSHNLMCRWPNDEFTRAPMVCLVVVVACIVEKRRRKEKICLAVLRHVFILSFSSIMWWFPVDRLSLKATMSFFHSEWWGHWHFSVSLPSATQHIVAEQSQVWLIQMLYIYISLKGGNTTSISHFGWKTPLMVCILK